MQILLVTEKFDPHENQRDGGSRLVKTLQHAFGDALEIMQFGPNENSKSTCHFNYPFYSINRFENRLANANFIIEKVKAVEQKFTHIIFSHISMQFGLVNLSLQNNIKIITFPMFLTASYQLSGEVVPKEYFEIEYAALKKSHLILTPSYLEKRQLIKIYSIPEEMIRVIPRGVDSRFIVPSIRSFNNILRFCSIGSIKPQKNTLELVSLFGEIRHIYKNATFQIIGPIQNQEYYKKVETEIKRLKLDDAVEFQGYVPPNEICNLIKTCHFHLSTSLCETFGRSIFETLAAGIPNIARIKNNAATEFLSHLPYIRFVNNNSEALSAIEEMLSHLETLSLLSAEIGILYNDKLLSKLLVAEISQQDIIAISDFDGTLYHKNDSDKTQNCINAFRQFSKRIICSARNVEDLLNQLNYYNLNVDWIIACSGAVVTDGQGKICWSIPLETQHIKHLESLIEHTKHIVFEDTVLQICGPTDTSHTILGLRTEIYQNNFFIQQWKASKLHAIHTLLNHIDYTGRVRVFGDGKYDLEMLTYFDGTLVST
jgi:glycosyltransferase involved in cell wall biosynthesis